MTALQRSLLIAFCCIQAGLSEELRSLPGSAPLTGQEDLSMQMVAGIDKFLSRRIAASPAYRQSLWHEHLSSQTAANWVEAERQKLRLIIGAADTRLPLSGLELVATTQNPALLAETETFTVQTVRWPVLEGVFGEGLWLKPKGKTWASVVALGDADQTPEMLVGLAPGLSPERQFARRLVEHGCEVLVPVLINREDQFSGSDHLKKYTNQPHREWIYRQAYELGHHIIGYEVEKVEAAIDFFAAAESRQASYVPGKIGIVGYGEGGLIGFYASALDRRVGATLISGYFNARQNLWEEPIYRNVFGLHKEFGDAEIATLVAPGSLIVEHSEMPRVDGPPKVREGRSGAAPGKLYTPDSSAVESEFERARSLVGLGGTVNSETLVFIAGMEGGATGPVSDRALIALLNRLGIPGEQCKPPGPAPANSRIQAIGGPLERQARQVRQLEDYTQKLFRASEQGRDERFWNRIGATSSNDWEETCSGFRQEFREDVIGTFGAPGSAPNARTRCIQDRTKWTVYEVVLDVYPDVFAWGYLLVPKDVKPGERRPVVVCQHGLEGLPADVIEDDPKSSGYRYYKAFAARLAERGFIVFAPHNPYRGGDRFRVLQRKANPLGASLFSIIVAQHQQALKWLSGLPFVDSKRIGFYGLSYGGKTAMRVPAILKEYSLSICSGDFNEWIRKNVSVDSPVSYMFTGEYEMPEWNLGRTFNYAEMAALIAPRPFMVERGHSDGVGLDEWVAYEYAKVLRLYGRLGIPNRTEIEFFDGPHTIHGVGTFKFLEEQLGWSGPPQR